MPRNELDCCARVTTQIWYFPMPLPSWTKLGNGKRRRKMNHPIAARFGACMLIYTKAVLSARPEDVNNFIHTLYWDYRCKSARAGKFCIEFTGGSNRTPWSSKKAQFLRSLQYDIEAPCIMHWGLFWHPAPSERSLDQN